LPKTYELAYFEEEIKFDSVGATGSMTSNEGRSAASFCRQVASWFPDKFCNLYLVKNHKIVKNSTTTKAREKIITDLES
jgi:hypothetical protein